MPTQIHQGYEHIWRKNGFTDKCAQPWKGDMQNWNSVASPVQRREIRGHSLLIDLWLPRLTSPPSFLVIGEFFLTYCTRSLSVVTFFQPVLALIVPGPTLLLCDSGLSLRWFKPVLRLQGQNSFHVLTLAAHMLKILFMMSFSFFTFIILPVSNGVF